MDNNKSIDNKDWENERRIDHLVNLVEKSTRTQRHLEEHSDISRSPDNIELVKEIQKERNDQIEDLKNKIVYGDAHNREKQIENTEKRFLYAEGYLNNNAEHMDNETFKNTKEKQEHRKENLDSLF
ncbi:MAG: hypothetical protein EWM47_11905 [Anaerolineaceae bacterium]|nr:MAG: hypothetical protein EWM47_11905 [Anaerolineaceae bacterium]